MKQMVENDDHRHMSPRALALHAPRIGKVLASPSTWYRLVKSAGMRRPRNRVYPANPKIGLRAKAPGELLHLDVTIIRLLDGTSSYPHAVIDNYSRRILSWALEESLGSGGTCRVLFAALHRLIEFYDRAHNEVMPQSAFQGQTPDEAFFGIGDEDANRLTVARKAAREKETRGNRAVGCGVCVEETSSGAFLLQRARSETS